MNEIEAAGETITGAALARAVEPEVGEDGHTHERACLNCGTSLVGPHCHNCGQAAHAHRTIAAWWHDLLHGVLHLDGKIWRTLPLLAWRPGDLTRRYIHGERAKFVSPLALFLFSVFLMFAVFSATGNSLIGNPPDLRTERANGGAAEQEPVMLELGNAPAPLRAFDEAYRRAKQNPSLLIYKVQANAYKFSWALIPLSVPFLWLLLLHRRRYRQEFSGYDHFVFITYSISAMSLTLIAFVLLEASGISFDLLDMAFVLIPPVHIYRQLRGAYGLSRWSAAWRTFALLWFAVIVLALFGLMLLAMGVLA